MMKMLKIPRMTWRLLAILILLAGAESSSGQDEYVIGGGDVLQINVWKNAELSQVVTVRPDGGITLPLVRDVAASGITATQLGKVVAEKLSAFVNAPNVTVTVAAANSYRAYTQGAIPAGMHTLAAPTTVRQLLSRAGTPAPGADLSRAYLLRGDTRIPLDLSPEAGEGAEGAASLLLSAGDVLVVPFRDIAAGRVLVVGEVAHPRAVPFSAGMTVLDALLDAGGGTTSADLKKAKIARRGSESQPEELPVDLEEVLKNGALERNLLLKAGDILVVPFLETTRVLVIGEVRTPKALPYRDGLTVLESYVEAGGGTDFADLDSVKVFRCHPEGKREEIAVDLERVLRKGDFARNIRLSPGDLVVVPK